jgi:hypothetical protein
MHVCIMRQCFGVGTYGSWLGLTIPALGWDVTNEKFFDWPQDSIWIYLNLVLFFLKVDYPLDLILD